MESEVKVWDLFVRVGHWSLVVLFFTAYFTEGEPVWLHSWAGYLIFGYVVLRSIWGLVGPKHARFSDFLYAPSAVVAYLKGLFTGHAERHLGHSPAGGVMVVALLAALLLTTVSGMATLAEEEGQGPLAPILAEADAGALAFVSPARADEDDEDEEHEERDGGESESESQFEELHELFGTIALVLVILHILGVIAAMVAHGDNLVGAMITGLKRAGDGH